MDFSCILQDIAIFWAAAQIWSVLSDNPFKISHISGSILFHAHLTHSYRVQVRRFTNDILRVLKCQPSKRIRLRDYPDAFQTLFGVPKYQIQDYGMCLLTDALTIIPHGKQIELSMLCFMHLIFLWHLWSCDLLTLCLMYRATASWFHTCLNWEL